MEDLSVLFWGRGQFLAQRRLRADEGEKGGRPILAYPNDEGKRALHHSKIKKRKKRGSIPRISCLESIVTAREILSSTPLLNARGVRGV